MLCALCNMRSCSCIGVWLAAAAWQCSVVLNMRGNRWCGSVERQHKANGIYYVGGCSVWACVVRVCQCVTRAVCSQSCLLNVPSPYAVDLWEGVFYHECYDPESRSYSLLRWAHPAAASASLLETPPLSPTRC